MVSGKFSGNFGGKFSGNFDILINILYEKAFQPQYIVIRRLWQGRRDSNTQPTVLETATLPLSHSPKKHNNYITNQ